MAATVPNLAPGTYTVTVNAVGGIANAGTYTVTSSGPPEPTRPSPPRSVSATAGNASALVSWLPPLSSGDYPVTRYQATASPGGRTCLVRGTSCEVKGLTNGKAYTFTVRALAGSWSLPSPPSAKVTPRAPTITITGSREGRRVSVEGTTTGFGMGGMVIAHTRTSRGAPYTKGDTALVSVTGGFEWSRSVGKRKTLWVYFTGGGAKSNVVRLRP